MRKEKGITLVALVVTIIVLLILAGVTIAIVLGQNGIFGKAETAKENTTIAQEKEAIRLGALEATVENKTNNIAFATGFKVEGATVTAKTDAYEVIFSGSGNKYTTDANGQNIQGPTQGGDTPVASMYDNPYVPEGFTHTEGEWNTGFVIQDHTNGNEFVWIPVGCEINGIKIELKRTIFEKNYGDTSLYREELDSSFAESVANKGGYYIGRYEASYGGGTSASDYIAQSKKVEESRVETGSSWIKDSAHIGYLWNWVSQPDAIVACENMYKGSSITSKLMSSYAWDTALTFINAVEGKNVSTDSSTWGNYYNDPFSGANGLAGTGVYEQTKACNIYDLAGNVWEWTTERYNTSNATYRGGDCANDGTRYPVGARNDNILDNTSSSLGFRALIYV